MKFSDLSKPKKAAVKYGAGEVNITYLPNTVALRRELKERENGDSEGNVLHVLARRIKSWDVFDEEDQPVKIEEGFLATCDDDFILALWGEINGNPTQATSPDS